MLASRQVEIPFFRGIRRQRRWGFGALAKDIGKTAIPLMRNYIVPVAERVGADLINFALPVIADVVSDRKTFKTAAKGVGRQTLREQMGKDSKKRSASKVIPTKSAEQTSRSPRDIFTNTSHQSCRVTFHTNILRQFLEIMQGKSN